MRTFVVIALAFVMARCLRDTPLSIKEPLEDLNTVQEIAIAIFVLVAALQDVKELFR